MIARPLHYLPSGRLAVPIVPRVTRTWAQPETAQDRACRAILEQLGPIQPTRLSAVLRRRVDDGTMLPRWTRLWPDLCEDDDGRVGFTWQEWA